MEFISEEICVNYLKLKIVVLKWSYFEAVFRPSTPKPENIFETIQGFSIFILEESFLTLVKRCNFLFGESYMLQFANKLQ